MVRANRVAESVALQKRVDAIAEGAALMTGTSYTRTFIDGTADTLPNFTLEQVLYRNLEQIGVPAYTDEDWALAEALKKTFHGSGLQSIQAARHDPEAARRLKELTDDGKRAINDFLPPPCSNTDFTPGSTDVGDVSWLTPTAQIETACWPAGVPGHSWQIVACGKSGLAHKGMLYAAKALAGAAIDLMSDESLLQRAKEEFDDRAAEGYVCPIEPDAVPIAL
jgi:aminobenzoyl-glutamate utilization protein B